MHRKLSDGLWLCTLYLCSIQKFTCRPGRIRRCITHQGQQLSTSAAAHSNPGTICITWVSIIMDALCHTMNNTLLIILIRCSEIRLNMTSMFFQVASLQNCSKQVICCLKWPYIAGDLYSVVTWCTSALYPFCMHGSLIPIPCAHIVSQTWMSISVTASPI